MWRNTMAAGTGLEKSQDLRMRFKGLMRLLAKNSEMLELMADLEADLHHLHPDEHRVRQPILRLLQGSLLLAENLNFLTDNRFKALYRAHRQIEGEVREYLRSFPPPDASPIIVPLHQAGAARINEVGGKAAGLGDLLLAMPDLVPAGFVITTSANRMFIRENGLHDQIRTLLNDLNIITGREMFKERVAAARALIENSPIPRKIAEAIADGVMRFPMPWPSRWAVRSSAVGEDGRMSFAGQFDSFLDVPTNELQDAYKKVIASRYTDRAVLYRLAGGFTEADTPMAVLFMPCIEARCAGVLYTRDPSDEGGDRAVINCVHGLANDMVGGKVDAFEMVVSRDRPGAVFAHRSPGDKSPLSENDLERLVRTGIEVEKFFNRPQDMEWVMSHDDKLWLVQTRRLRFEDRRLHGGQPIEKRPAMIEGGTTIFPGRAVGAACLVKAVEELEAVPEAAVLVVRQATPEIAPLLPTLAGVVAEHGNAAGHAAALIREFGVPTLFGVEGLFERVRPGQTLGLDATNRKLFEGSPWPEVAKRVEARIRKAQGRERRSLLNERILSLNLTDPVSVSFRAARCETVHDIVRFTHEKAVATMFEMGDRAAGRSKKAALSLDTDLIRLAVLDLGGAVPESDGKKRVVQPDRIMSAPFQALWKGITFPGVSWTGRKTVSGVGFVSVLAASMADPMASVRALGEMNYIVVAPEYMNFNARLAYHFAMLDSLVCDAAENNYVNFRFRGGGAGAGRKRRRARFLADVLLSAGFGVDRRGDLVTAWLRRYPRQTSEQGLTLVGKLMGCARQLDMLLDSDTAIKHYVERFMLGDYRAFA